MSSSNVTVFDLEIDASKEEKPPTLFELLPGEQFILRCNVSAGANPSNPSLIWLHNGANIENENMGGKFISMSDDQLRSTLNISSSGTNDDGLFECSVKNLNGVRKSAKIKIERQFDESIKTNEEELCNLTHRAQCRHKSLCVVNKKTGFMSCKCPADYYGPSCQYAIIRPKTYLIPDEGAAPPPIYDCQRDRQEYTKNLAIFSSITISVVLLMFVAILLILRRKSRIHSSSHNSKSSFDESEALNFCEPEYERCSVCGNVKMENIPSMGDEKRKKSNFYRVKYPLIPKKSILPNSTTSISSFEDSFKQNRVTNLSLEAEVSDIK